MAQSLWIIQPTISLTIIKFILLLQLPSKENTNVNQNLMSLIFKLSSMPQITIPSALRFGLKTVQFNFSFLHHILAWESTTKFLQKDISKQFLTGVKLVYFNLFFTGPRLLLIKKISGPLLLNTLSISTCIIIYLSVTCVSHQPNTLPAQFSKLQSSYSSTHVLLSGLCSWPMFTRL